jgi:hypothetical protein
MVTLKYVHGVSLNAHTYTVMYVGNVQTVMDVSVRALSLNGHLIE